MPAEMVTVEVRATNVGSRSELWRIHEALNSYLDKTHVVADDIRCRGISVDVLIPAWRIPRPDDPQNCDPQPWRVASPDDPVLCEPHPYASRGLIVRATIARPDKPVEHIVLVRKGDGCSVFERDTGTIPAGARPIADSSDDDPVVTEEEKIAAVRCVRLIAARLCAKDAQQGDIREIAPRVLDIVSGMINC